MVYSDYRLQQQINNLGAGAVTPNYTPPDFLWKDTGNITLPVGRYYMAGHRIGGQYQNYDGMGIYHELSTNTDLDVDGSSLVGGDVISSWYSIWMKDDGTMLVLPYIRVDVISYSSPDTTINPADHYDGTTANDNFVDADDCFNNYRLVYISFDSNNGSTWTISDSVNGTPDQIKVSGDITSVVGAGNWLQMIPKASDIYVYLGTVGLDSSGDLRELYKRGWKYQYKSRQTIAGYLSVNAGNTELGSAIPAVAKRFFGTTMVEATGGTNIYLVGVYFFSGDNGGDIISEKRWQRNQNGTTWLGQRVPFDAELTTVTLIRNYFHQYDGSAKAATAGNFYISGWEE